MIQLPEQIRFFIIFNQSGSLASSELLLLWALPSLTQQLPAPLATAVRSQQLCQPAENCGEGTLSR